MTSKISSLSLLELTKPRSVERLGDAFEQLGFVIITDHNISEALIDPFLGMFKQFFAWPEQRKLNYRLAQAGGARGYTPLDRKSTRLNSSHRT